uniref:DUF4440 domain-containing protein n=1 Tax=Pseudoalteromonas rubra TaxID=43658 RepID=A0A0F4QKX6_9GAMM|nr:hypothetical protein TW77_12645 [Pseudoalteromonas rubra]
MALFILLLTIPIQAKTDIKILKQQVWAAELAFAKTMADRDHQAFTEFLAVDAVFMGGGNKVNRGKQMVSDSWAKLFDSPKAPFAWKPERVEVLDNGTLALSTGPVWDDQGRFHTYTSIWRKEANGRWKVIFDKGDRYCPPKSKE